MNQPLKLWFLERITFWKLNLICWTFFSIFSLVERLTFFPTYFEAAVVMLVQIPLAVILSGLMREVYRRPSVSNPYGLRTTVWIIMLSLVAALIQSGIVHMFALEMRWFSQAFSMDVALGLRIKFYWFVFMAWSVGYFGIRAEMEANVQSARARQAQDEARRIELQMLRAQLDPHFLFNSLNSVAAEIRPHPDAALAMVRELSDYLRYSLDHRNRPTGTLSAELDAVDAYLRIQHARFGDRFQTSITADLASRSRKVPTFLLQPLVENAAKYGMGNSDGKLELNLMAGLTGDTLAIEVKNSGRLKPVSDQRVGVGLTTLRRRLELHYPGRHSFELVESGGYVSAQITLKGAPCFGS